MTCVSRTPIITEPERSNTSFNRCIPHWAMNQTSLRFWQRYTSLQFLAWIWQYWAYSRLMLSSGVMSWRERPRLCPCTSWTTWDERSCQQYIAYLCTRCQLAAAQHFPQNHSSLASASGTRCRTPTAPIALRLLWSTWRSPKSHVSGPESTLFIEESFLDA